MLPLKVALSPAAHPLNPVCVCGMCVGVFVKEKMPNLFLAQVPFWHRSALSVSALVMDRRPKPESNRQFVKAFAAAQLFQPCPEMANREWQYP